ncbi:MAG TPA: NADH-ubiquinone oxidoreductase-F iron-sulfur binding region domain-containing protein [Kofleriaceae bacterium]|nr:NADH-ubiquinone oxidoreductase-F iron-sulfur binding region domain-containing protein [Kofleriaceae bacterium]
MTHHDRILTDILRYRDLARGATWVETAHMPMPTLAPSARAHAIVERFRAEPAPVLAILHALQSEVGWLDEADLATVSDALRIPYGDLFGVVTFYSYFRTARPAETPRWVCTGPACRMRAQDGAPLPSGEPTACPGRCDTPIASLTGARSITPLPSPPFFPAPPGEPQAVLLANALHADQPLYAQARARGAYRAWEAARAQPAEQVIAELTASGLAGRGGAGFPTGVKWSAVRAAAGAPKYVVVNADEGEPITFKDRPILERDPHLLLEGMRIAAHAVGATIGIIYLRFEYPEAEGILLRAIDDARQAGWLGDGFDVWVRRGAGAYICGEETSLLNSLEGKKPFPRDKPPYPTTHGLFGRPTLVNNVETLAAVPRIVERGAAFWKASNPKLYSIAGDVARPGNYEAPLGTTVRALVERAGGVTGGALQFFTMGGLSGGLLSAAELDLALDFQAPKQYGTMLGSGGLLVGNTTRCPVDAVRAASDFFRHESCGKCFPCRIGTERVSARLSKLATGTATARDVDEMREIGRVMTRTSACGLGVAAPAIVDGLFARFPAVVQDHLAGRCAHKVCHV